MVVVVEYVQETFVFLPLTFIIIHHSVRGIFLTHQSFSPQRGLLL